MKKTVAFAIIGMMAWVLVATIASQYLVGLVLSLFIRGNTTNSTIVIALYSVLSYLMTVALVVYLPSRWSVDWYAKYEGKKHKKEVVASKGAHNVNRQELGLMGLPTWTDIGLAPVGFIVYLLLAAGLTAIFSQFGWFDVSETQNVGFNSYIFGFDRIIAFFTLVVVAPVAEELIFRGWLYGKIRGKLWGKIPHWAAILVASVLVSLLFGFLHGQWNVGVSVFALSMVLCGMREVTGTIYAGILLHMLKNGVAFYLLYVLGFGL